MSIIISHYHLFNHLENYFPFTVINEIAIISRESGLIIVGTPSVFDYWLSSNKGTSFGDHLAVQFIINIDKPDCIQGKIIYRKYRDMNIK